MADTRAKETVIVVHGTFSGKQDGGRPGWYAPGQSFCRDLDRELGSRGAGATCWDHLIDKAEYFHWDGKNDWLSRTKAAAELRNMLKRLHSEGWVVHLVGHSHGGNIIIDAVTDEEGRVESWFTGRIALLGTPIYSDSSDYTERRRSLLNRWLLVSLIVWGALLIYASQGVDLLAPFQSENPSIQAGATSAAVVALVGAIVLLIRTVSYLLSKNAPIRLISLRMQLGLQPFLLSEFRKRRSPAFMMINSRYDEAYKALSPLRDAENPLLKGSDSSRAGKAFLVELADKLFAVSESGRSSLQSIVQRTLEVRQAWLIPVIGAILVFAVLFWKSVFSAIEPEPPVATSWSLAYWAMVSMVLAIAGFFNRVVYFPGIVVTDLAKVLWRGLMSFLLLTFDKVVKTAVWGFIKSFAMGLNGAPRRVKDIRVSREFETSLVEDHVYLELPEDIVSGVTESQQPRLNEIQGILYGQGTSWDPTELLKALEEKDFPLIHTTYYRNPECIRKIADWIAEPVEEYRDGKPEHEVMRKVGRRDEEYQAYVAETVRGPNIYREHVDGLKQKHAPPGSRWVQKPDLGASADGFTDRLKRSGPPPRPTGRR